MGIHVKPSDAAQEIEALAAAFQQASDFHGTTRGAIMGDMNAGCRCGRQACDVVGPSSGSNQ